MLGLFLQQATATIAAAKTAHQCGDWPGVERAVHSLKSSAGNVGARVLQHLADTIERLAETADGEPIGPLLPELEAAFRRIVLQIERLKEGHES